MTFPPRWDSRSAPRSARRPFWLPLLGAVLLVAATAYGLYTAAHPPDLHLIYPTHKPTEAP